ncbi:MAG: response regulator transcription factor [Chloroflexi bacterium]|nr:response regulator transcription factor [Chloroflexota bacterium]
MSKPRIGVLIASEQPQVRDFFKEMVEKEGAFPVGQAADVASALVLARQLRPDAAVIDPYLPYTIGIDSLRLSRTGGLDAAQMISEELPNTQAIVVNNLSEAVVAECSLDKTAHCFFRHDVSEGNARLRLQELYRQTRPLGPIFANIEVQPRVSAVREAPPLKLGVPEKLILFGGFGIFGGWFLTITVIGALVGIPLSAAGAIAVLSGIVSRLIASRRARRNRKVWPEDSWRF